jgi:hypothetical protein
MQHSMMCAVVQVTHKGAHFMGAVDTTGDTKSGAFIAEVRA